jgi:hypothetical protein
MFAPLSGCAVYRYSPANPFSALGILRRKIRKGLAAQYLGTQLGQRGLSHDRMKGRVGYGGVCRRPDRSGCSGFGQRRSRRPIRQAQGKSGSAGGARDPAPSRLRAAPRAAERRMAGLCPGSCTGRCRRERPLDTSFSSAAWTGGMCRSCWTSPIPNHISGQTAVQQEALQEDHESSTRRLLNKSCLPSTGHIKTPAC